MIHNRGTGRYLHVFITFIVKELKFQLTVSTASKEYIHI